MLQNEVFTSDKYHEVYPKGIELHFWNKTRNDLAYRWLSPHLHEGDLVMDVGYLSWHQNTRDRFAPL